MDTSYCGRILPVDAAMVTACLMEVRRGDCSILLPWLPAMGYAGSVDSGMMV